MKVRLSYGWILLESSWKPLESSVDTDGCHGRGNIFTSLGPLEYTVHCRAWRGLLCLVMSLPSLSMTACHGRGNIFTSLGPLEYTVHCRAWRGLLCLVMSLPSLSLHLRGWGTGGGEEDRAQRRVRCPVTKCSSHGALKNYSYHSNPKGDVFEEGLQNSPPCKFTSLHIWNANLGIVYYWTRVVVGVVGTH